MAGKSYTFRVTSEGLTEFKRDLEALGPAGDAAFKKIADSSPQLANALNKAAEAAERTRQKLADVGRDGAPGLKALGAAGEELGGELEGLAGRVPVVGAALEKLGPWGRVAALALAGVTTVLALGSAEAERYNRALGRIEGVLRATGNASGLTSKQIAETAEAIARSTNATSQGALEAAAALATFGSVSGDAFRQALKLSQDLATVFGGDMRDKAVALGKALENPVEGLTALRRAGIQVTAAQRDMIAAMVAAGDQAGAQAAVLKLVQERVGGAGAGERQGLSGAIKGLGDAWSDFLKEVGKTSGFMTDAVQATQKGVRDITHALTPEGRAEAAARTVQAREAAATAPTEPPPIGGSLTRGFLAEQRSRTQAPLLLARSAADDAQQIVFLKQLEEAYGAAAAAAAGEAAAEDRVAEAAGTRFAAMGQVFAGLNKELEIAKLSGVEKEKALAADRAELEFRKQFPNAVESEVAARRALAVQIVETAHATDVATKADQDWLKVQSDHAIAAQALEDKRGEVNQSISDHVKAINIETDALKLGDKERAVQLELLKAEAELKKVNGILDPTTAANIRAAVERREDTKKEIEERAKAAEAAQRRIEQTIQHSTDRIVDFSADAFDKIFEKGKASWTEIWEQAKTTARRALAQIAAEAIIRPIIQPIVASVVGGIMGGGSASASPPNGVGGPSTGSGGAAAGSGGGLDIFGIGSSLVSLGSSLSGSGGLMGALGLTGMIDSLGAALGFSPGVTMASLGAEAGLFSSQLPNAAGSLFGGTTLSGLLGGAGAGFAAGSLLNSLIGGNPLGGTIGSGVGGLAGAVIGSIIPGVGTLIGGLIGGAGGGLLGGLFGNNRKSVGPGGGASINSGDPLGPGRLVFQNAGGDNGFDTAGSISGVGLAAAAFNKILDKLGSGPVHSLTGTLEFPAGGSPNVRTYGPAGWFSTGVTPENAVETMVQYLLKAVGPMPGVSADVTTAIKNSKATNLTDLLSDVDFASALSGVVIGPAEKLTQSEQVIAEINKQFDELTTRATDLGLAIDGLSARRDEAIAKLTEGFNAALDAGVNGFIAPMKAQMDALGKAQAERVKEAKALGADLVQVERLNALERAAVLDQALGGVKALLAELTTGGLSGLSPMASYDAARAKFEAQAAAAQAGTGSPDFAAAARAFIEASRSSFASGGQFQVDRLNVLGVLAALGFTGAPALAGVPGFADEGSFRVPSGGGRDGMVPFFRVDGGETVSVRRDASTGSGSGDTAAKERHAQMMRGFGVLAAEMQSMRLTLGRRDAQFERLMAKLDRLAGAG